MRGDLTTGDQVPPGREAPQDEAPQDEAPQDEAPQDEAPLSLTKQRAAAVDEQLTGPIPVVAGADIDRPPMADDWPGDDFDPGEPLDATGQPRDTERRFTLRTRLIALVLGVAAIALIAVDILLPLNVRSSLMESKDLALRTQVTPGSDGKVSIPTQSDTDSPTKGELGVTFISSTGVRVVYQRLATDPGADPVFGQVPPTVVPETVRDKDGQGTFRALAVATEFPWGDRGYAVFWVPLADVTKAVGSVVFTELLISLALLILLGTTASVIIRRELRPLEAMATAADDIARGDLDRRVYPGDAGTEVGRLGFAFNGMLDGISELVAEREANELRMRQFLADASHELRTPVAAVRGYTDLYRAGALPDDPAVDRAMERMGFEAERMGALVGDLLMLVQADAESDTRREVVDLADVLTGVVDDAAVIDRSRTWRLVGVAPGVALVQGDRLRLHQLFANLLGNIRTHTDPGTTATVSLLASTSELTVTVVDDGPGVSASDLPRLFDRFYRVDASRSRVKGGTGLGLSIVAAIVRTHRGRVMASHTPGGGLTTTVVLPRFQAATESDDAQPEVNRT